CSPTWRNGPDPRTSPTPESGRTAWWTRSLPTPASCAGAPGPSPGATRGPTTGPANGSRASGWGSGPRTGTCRGSASAAAAAPRRGTDARRSGHLPRLHEFDHVDVILFGVLPLHLVLVSLAVVQEGGDHL